jgi:6-phosphofructokinase 1
MERGSVSGILHQGGTILRTFRYPDFVDEERDGPVGKALKKLKLDGMIVIGGDGSFRGAHKLMTMFGLPVVGVPATIDNDIPGTDRSIGYDTALNIAVDAVDKIKDTASSHGRIFVIEVMGRHYGLLAAQVAMATGAEETLVPEIPYDIDEICQGIETAYSKGKYHALIIVAEGAGRASQISYDVKSRLNRSVRMVVLGHIQRGGAPTAFDRILATRMSHHAAELLMDGEHGVMVGIVANRFKTSSLNKRGGVDTKVVERNWQLAQLLG